MAAPASEEASGPVVVEDGGNGLAPPVAVASSAAVVSSDETSGKEHTAEGLERRCSCTTVDRASNGLVCIYI